MSERSADAITALRQIQRRIELDARRLAREAKLTHSQLRVLQLLDENEMLSASEIAQEIKLSNATITSLVEKLVHRNLIERRKCETDKRRVWLKLLPDGVAALENVPKDLQQNFEAKFSKLPSWEQAMLVAALEKVTSLLDADNIDAASILTIGEIGKLGESKN